MTKPPLKTEQAIAYLSAHPELRVMGAKRLQTYVTELVCGVKTWGRAKSALGWPTLPAGGQWRYNAIKKPTIAPLAPLTGTTPVYADVQFVEIDKPLKVVHFVSSEGTRTVEKKTRKALVATVALLEYMGWREVSARAGVAVYERIDTQGGY